MSGGDGDGGDVDTRRGEKEAIVEVPVPNLAPEDKVGECGGGAVDEGEVKEGEEDGRGVRGGDGGDGGDGGVGVVGGDGGAIQLKVSEKQIQFVGTLERSQLGED